MAGKIDSVRISLVLAGLTLALGLAGAISLLGRGAWLDEFWTIVSTRPGQSGADFLAVMRREVHPLLHYGLVQLGQWAGIESIAALRALNFLGVPLTLWALWLAWRAQAISPAQAAIVVALYASSPMFLDYAAELRAYFLAFSSSVAVALFAKVLAQQAARNEVWRARWLMAWAFALFIFVNLHYFALLLGGILTLALFAARRGRGVLGLALASALAATPAVLTFLAQTVGADGALTSWIATGRLDAAYAMIDAVFLAGAYNLAAFGAAIAVLLWLADNRASWSRMMDDWMLIVAVIGFCAFLFLANMLKPVVIDRYLNVMGGVVIVALAGLSGAPAASRWAPVAACVFALCVQVRLLHDGVFARRGWEESGAAAARFKAACPASEVFIDPIALEPEGNILVAARRHGQLYYAEKLGLSVREIAPGQRLPAPGNCPNLLWIEHFWPNGEDPLGPELMAHLRLEYDGAIELHRVGAGFVLINRAS